MLQGWKNFSFGFLTGGLLIFAFVFSTEWMISVSSAEQAAHEQAAEAVDARLAKICVNQFMHSPNLELRLNELRKLKDPWARAKHIKTHGWSTMPDKDYPSPGVADDCARLIMDAAYKE
jgi:hypothetical protein